MRRFTYKAKDAKSGRILSGRIQAENEQAAGKILVEQGYIPQKLVPEDEGLFAKWNNKIHAKQRITFTRQFATLIGAGLPLSNSLHLIAEQAEDTATQNLVEDLSAQIEGGKTLYEAFSRHPDVFNKVYLSLIAAGEASGTLDISLQRLASQQEKDANMMSKIRGAMTYPAIVLVVIVAVVAFLLIQVVPEVDNLYRSVGEELPAATKFLVGTANFLMNWWWTLLLGIGFLVWFFAQFRRTDVGKKVLATVKLNIPIFKHLFLRLYNSRFARTMQMLLSAGVPMLEAMEISGEAINNVILEDQMTQAATMVRSGKPLSVALKGRDYILPLLPQMAATGEQSGKIDEMLGKAAEVYERELDERLNAISTMIEPILMVLLAIACGVIVMGVLFPIYALVSKISA